MWVKDTNQKAPEVQWATVTETGVEIYGQKCDEKRQKSNITDAENEENENLKMFSMRGRLLEKAKNNNK